MLPENVFSSLWQSVRREWRICFISAFVLGLAAHLYRLTNWLPNWDGLVFRYDSSNMTHFGRYCLGLINSLSSYYELPWLNGLLALIYISLAAVCICALFSLKKSLTCALVGGMVAVFPTVTSTMTYIYTADGYAAALLCASISALLLARGGWKRCILAVLLLAFSCALYQAYITLAAVLLLIYLVDQLVCHGEEAAVSLKMALRFLGCGVLAVLLYYLVLQLILSVSGTQLSEYQELSEIGLSSLSPWLSAILCVKRFFAFFFDFSKGINAYSVINILLFALLLFFLLYAVLKKRIYAAPPRLGLLIIYLAAMPFAAAALYFVNPSVDYHNLMTMGYIGFPLILIVLYEQLDDLSGTLLIVKNWSVLLLSAAMIFNFIVIANISYHSLQMAYERSYGTAIRIADRIEQTEGAEDCGTLAVFGELPESEAYSLDIPPDITGSTAGYILRHDDAKVGQSVLTSVLNDYCGTDFRFASEEEKDALRESGTLEDMAFWPGRSCVAVQGDTVIIRLGEEP